jgi:hypothetical protein
MIRFVDCGNRSPKGEKSPTHWLGKKSYLYFVGACRMNATQIVLPFDFGVVSVSPATGSSSDASGE